MSETPTYKRIIEERLSHEIFSNDYLVKDSATEGTTRILISEFIDLVLADSPTEEDLAKILNDLAPEFSTQYSYASGNIVIYQEQLYEFTASKPAGNWDSSKVTQKSVSQLIADVKTRIDNEATARQNMDNQLASGISKQMSNLADFYDTTKSYVVGDVCVLPNGELKRCIAPTSGAFDITKWESVTVDELFDALNFSADAISYDNTSSGLEATNVQDAIDETITKLSAVGSASGDIATFPDGSDLSMPKLEVGIEPVQDLHGYDSPWVGGAGKNKLDVPDGSISQSGYIFNFTNLNLPAGKYTLNLEKTATVNLSLAVVTGETTPINTSISLPYSFEVADTITGMRLYVGSATNYSKVQLESGSTATTYEPYSNICPISGWDECNVGVSGVNIWDEEWEVGSIADGGAYVATQTVRSKNFNSIKPNANYKIVQKDGGTPMRVCFYDKNKTFISRTTNTVSDFTTPSNCYYFKLTSTVAYGATYNNDISVNYPSTDTSYHAYNGHTYTIDLDGTRYGGKVDLVSGVMTVDRVEKPMPANWSINAESSIYWLITHTTSDAISVENSDTSIRVISDGFKGVTANDILTQMTTTPNYVNCIAIISSKRLFLKVTKADYPTLNDLYSMIQTNNLRLVYELATPLTIQLTPTVVKSLQGQNNVWADTGAILDAEYIRDLTAIIDYILEQLNA